jgi:hypothetical protein
MKLWFTQRSLDNLSNIADYLSVRDPAGTRRDLWDVTASDRVSKAEKKAGGRECSQGRDASI